MNVSGFNGGRLVQLLRKEFRQMLRDPRARRMLFISPIVQLLIFGYAVNTDVRHARTMVVDHDRTAASCDAPSAPVTSASSSSASPAWSSRESRAATGRSTRTR